MTDKELYLHYRHILGFQKSKKYLKWMKVQFPNNDLHHLLGSVKSKKFTDYLVYPFEHSYHLNVVEKAKAFHFNKYLEYSLAYLMGYSDHLGMLDKHMGSYNVWESERAKDNNPIIPKKVKKFIELIHKVENE